MRDAVGSLEHRIDARYEAVDRRFQAIDRRFDSVDRRIDRLDDKVSRQFLRLVGLQITTMPLWFPRGWPAAELPAPSLRPAVRNPPGRGLPSVEASHMIMVRDLRKRFGDVRAVDGVSFDVPDGAITGLLGANGAGKSTTLGMMAGLLRPDAGRVEVDGRDARDARRWLGALLDHQGLYPRLTARENIAER